MVTFTRPITAQFLTSGLAGTLGYTIKSATGSTLVVRTITGITEDGTSGVYSASVANWDTTWSGVIRWDDGLGNIAVETFLAYDPLGNVTVGGYAAGQDPATLTGMSPLARTLTDKTGFGLAANGLDSVAIEAGVNARQAIALSAAALAGNLTGASTNSITIAGVNTTTTRIQAVVDTVGNRTVTPHPPV